MCNRCEELKAEVLRLSERVNQQTQLIKQILGCKRYAGGGAYGWDLSMLDGLMPEMFEATETPRQDEHVHDIRDMGPGRRQVCCLCGQAASNEGNKDG